ncbi:MAG: GAF domain-containing protein [Caulobacter sp.]|nr:GAF domain-containing protein [Caulobacter sp.]
MAEAFNDLVLSADREARYAELATEIAAVLEGEPNLVARMATVASMLAASFDHFFWTGFYVVDPARPGELVVGPYQGTLGCLRIAFGRGVCGAAAATGETQLVADVHAFPGHIACDGRSRSEVVVPVFDPAGDLIAVLDVDSDRPAAFDAVDALWLARITGDIFSR